MEISSLSSIEQEIHALVKVNFSSFSWLISAIYASPKYSGRRLLWNNLALAASLHNLPWVMLGDFNEILSSNEKFGGLLVNVSRALKFKCSLDTCGMLDLGFHGPKFTWTNRREFGTFIQERIDRGFVNVAWRMLYLEAQIHHLTKIHSDHNPILLSLEKDQDINLPRPFWFQPMWLSHPTFPDLVKSIWSNSSGTIMDKIKDFTITVKDWNKNIFRNHKK